MMDNAAVLSPVIAGDGPLLAVLDRFDECEAILNGNSVGESLLALQDRLPEVQAVAQQLERGGDRV